MNVKQFREFGEPVTEEQLAQRPEVTELRIGDLVFFQGSLWVLMGTYKQYYVCWLIPCAGFHFPLPPDYTQIDKLEVLGGPIFTLASCPKGISPSDHRDWLIAECDEIRKDAFRKRLTEVLKMNL